MAFVITAINRMRGRRASSHVGEECFIASPPSLTNSNPASAVIVEMGRFRAFTPSNHVCPTSVFRSHRNGFSVRSIPPRRFIVKTTATADFAKTKMVNANDQESTALAKTKEINHAPTTTYGPRGS